MCLGHGRIEEAGSGCVRFHSHLELGVGGMPGQWSTSRGKLANCYELTNPKILTNPFTRLFPFVSISVQHPRDRRPGQASP